MPVYVWFFALSIFSIIGQHRYLAVEAFVKEEIIIRFTKLNRCQISLVCVVISLVEFSITIFMLHIVVVLGLCSPGDFRIMRMQMADHQNTCKQRPLGNFAEFNLHVFVYIHWTIRFDFGKA